MTWFVQPLQRKDASGQPSGLWHLVAESDEGGGFYPGCDHDHSSAKEAQECKEAKTFLGGITGFPVREDELVDTKMTFDFTPEEVTAIHDLQRRQDLSAVAVMRQALRMYQLSVLGEPGLGPLMPPAP